MRIGTALGCVGPPLLTYGAAAPGNATTRMRMSEDPALRLGPDLQQLLAMMVTPPARVEEITTAPSTKSPRAAFRLHFTDGRLLKGRRFKSAAHALTARLAIVAAPPGMFPAVLAHHGEALLEEWVDGEALDPEDASSSILGEVGRTLATLHQSPVPGMTFGEEPRNGLLAMNDRLQRDLRHLTAEGMIARTRASRLIAVARRAAPARAQVGVAVRDVRPENLLRDREGRLVWVDTGSIMVGPVDEDLARIWHHWPMGDEARAGFLAAYQRVRDASDFLTSLPFWSVVVLAHSARIRADRGTVEGAIAAAELMDRLSRSCEAVDGASSVLPPAAPPSAPRAAASSAGEWISTIGGLRIAVHGNAPAPVDWLAEFFGPGQLGSAGTPDVEIRLTIDPVRYAAAHAVGRKAGDRTMPAFTVDGSERHLELWQEQTDGWFLHDEAAELFFGVHSSPPHYRLLGGADHGRLRSALMRLVRELTTVHAMSQGDLLVHASAVAKNGSAVLFAGPANSGKTSLLLHALEQEGVAFLTNDRALLAVGESATLPPTVRGSPTIVRFRPSSLDFLPGLEVADWQRSFPYTLTAEEARNPGSKAALLPGSKGRALFSMSPAQLCRWRGVQFDREAQARVLVFPRLDEQVDSYELRSLHAGEAAPLLASCMGFGSGEAEPARTTAATWRRPVPPAPRDPATVCRQIAAECTLLECRLGAGAFEAPGIWSAILHYAGGGQ
jgi:hypothetical protein